MGGRCLVVASPRLKKFFEAVAGILSSAYPDLDQVFLPLPVSVERELAASIVSGASFSEFLRGYGEVFAKYFYFLKPVYNAILSMWTGEPGVEVLCYLPGTPEDAVSFSVEAGLLVAKTVITGRVDVDAWLALLSKVGEPREEADLISFRLMGKAFIVATRAGTRIARILSGKGVLLDLVELGPYVPTPLERLLEGPRDPRRVERLVLEHAEYVRNYVLTSRDLDEAYMKWVKRVHPWLGLYRGGL